jgi:hypothetical protein
MKKYGAQLTLDLDLEADSIEDASKKAKEILADRLRNDEHHIYKDSIKIYH